MPLWYTDVGLKILQTMVINSFMPYVGIVVGFVVSMLKQKLDSKFTDNKYVTKQTSMAKYKLIYGGGDYLIHFKYSEFMNVYYITMMYGVGIPLLFPVAALYCFNAYISEKIIVSYFVRLPPSMDDSLTKMAVGMLKNGPLFLLCNGWWMLSNQQIYDNIWSLIANELTPMNSKHYLLQLNGVNKTTPVLFMISSAILMIITQIMFSHKLQEWGFAM